MKVAYYSPLPPERSGIADYSALLLPALSRRADVEVVQRGAESVDADVHIYHVGNSPDAHGWIVDALRRRPGVVVLHELVLHHLVAGITLGRGDVDGYLGALEREVGLLGRMLGRGVVEGTVVPLWASRPQDYPLVGEILELAAGHGLIAHSEYVLDRARSAGYDGPAWRIPMPVWPTPDVAAAQLDGDPLIGTFGFLNSLKRIPQLLEAFAALRERRPDARLLLVGPESPEVELERRIAALGLDEAVVREGYVSEERLWSLIAACDVCVSLRWPTMGETSAGMIRVLSLSRPLVVSDVDAFRELPDAVAFKVPVDEREVDTLAGALELVSSRKDVWAQMSEAARAHAAREHDVDRAADLYAEALAAAAR